jgi:hypothetical protein
LSRYRYDQASGPAIEMKEEDVQDAEFLKSNGRLICRIPF